MTEPGLLGCSMVSVVQRLARDFAPLPGMPTRTTLICLRSPRGKQLHTTHVNVFFFCQIMHDIFSSNGWPFFRCPTHFPCPPWALCEDPIRTFPKWKREKTKISNHFLQILWRCTGFRGAKQEIIKHFCSGHDAVATHCETLFELCIILHFAVCDGTTNILLLDFVDVSVEPIAAHFGNEIM